MDRWVGLVIAVILEQISGMKRKRVRKSKGIDPKVLDAYNQWISKHLDELVRRHAGKYVSVYRNKVVAIGDSYKEVWDAAEKQGVEEPPLVMQIPGIEDLEAIL